MMKILKKYFNLKVLIVALVITVFGCWILQNFSVIITLGKNNEKMDVQVYYQLKNNLGFSEQQSVIAEKDKNVYKGMISKHFAIDKAFRIDVDGEKNFEIKKVEVKWNGFLISKLNSEEFINRIEYVSGFNLEGDKYVATNEDPFVVCDLLTHNQYLKYIILLFFEFVLLGLINLTLCTFFAKHKEPKYIKIIVCISVCLIVGQFVVQSINEINKTKLQSYYVNEERAEYKSINNKELKTEFICVSNKMNSLQIMIQEKHSTNGKIIYEINKNGKNIIQKEKKIKKVLSDDKQGIILDVSDANLKQGEKYILKTKLIKCENDIKVEMFEEHLLLQQNFYFTHYILYYSILVLIILVFLLLMVSFLKKGLTIKFFVLCSICIGSLVVLFMPPGSRDDEYRHFLRAYSLSQGMNKIEPTKFDGTEIGNFAFEEKGKGYFLDVPKQINDLRLVDYTFNYNNKSYYAEVNQKMCIDRWKILIKEKDIDNASRVSMVATAQRGIIYYWPQTLFILIGILLKVKSFLLFYLARLGQLVITTLIGAVSLKLSGNKKNIIWLVWFIPNVVLLRSSCNTDGFLISLLILYLALIIYIKDKKIQLVSEKKGILNVVLLSVLTVYITLMKPPYLIYCVFTLLILEKDNFRDIIKNLEKSYKKYLICMTGFVAICVGVIIWKKAIILKGIYAILPKQHIQYMFANPKIVGKLFMDKWFQQIIEVGKSVNGYFGIPYLMIMVVCLFALKNDIKIWKKIMLIIGFCLIVMGMVLVGYTLTPPDYGQIWGITYRYLLPAVPMAATALPCGSENTQRYCEFVYPILILGTIICSIMTWFVKMWL